MNIDFQDILKELEFRVPTGIIDLNEESQVTTLVQILRENGVEDPNEIAQKARVYFSYVNEATPKPKVTKTARDQAHDMGLVGMGGIAYGPKGSDKVTHINKDGKLVALPKPVKKGEKISTSKPVGKNEPLKGTPVFPSTKTKPQTNNKSKNIETGMAVSVEKSRYGTHGSKELNQTKASNRLKSLPKSGIDTKKAVSLFIKNYPGAVTTKYEYPTESDKLLKSKLPPAGYDALKSILKMSKQGDFEPPISIITDQYGAGKISAQANELAMQAVFCFPNTKEGKVARNRFIDSMIKNADDIEKKGGVPILDKSWLIHMAGAHDAFAKNMDRMYGSGKWEVSGMTWDVRQQQEALGANYDEKGDSTDINAQVKIKGKIQNIEISCKKDWNIFLLNAGLGDASNWYYTLGAEKEMRAKELQKLKDAKDPRFGKKEDDELKQLNTAALSKAPIKNTELQHAQMDSAKKGFDLIREIPNKDFLSTIKDCMSRSKNDPLYIDKNEAEIAKKIQKYLNGTKKLDPEEFANSIGGGAKEFKKAVMIYHKLLGSYSGDTKWLESHKEITYDFMKTAAKTMASNKEFQGMLLKKLQEAIPVKTMVEGIETMQIDSMYITQEHMTKMFGTNDWNKIKEYLGIKVENGVAFLTYSAKGPNMKPFKIANIQMREKGVGYNGSVALECLPSKEFAKACKDIDEKINRG